MTLGDVVDRAISLRSDLARTAEAIKHGEREIIAVIGATADHQFAAAGRRLETVINEFISASADILTHLRSRYDQ